MPADKVMKKFGSGQLHSGSKNGPIVKNQKQAVAIMLSEKAKAAAGDPEYQDDDSKLAKSPGSRAVKRANVSKSVRPAVFGRRPNIPKSMY